MDDSMEIERLRILIDQENKMLGLLEESCKELSSTVDELQNRYDSVEDESNEWKTRFEIQQEINDVFRRQIPKLAEKLDDSRGNFNGAKRSGRANAWDISPNGVITNYTLSMLERQKMNLRSQETEILGRVDQEAKAYYKADEHRRNHRLEISAFSSNYGRFGGYQRSHGVNRSPVSQRKLGYTLRTSHEALGNRNIPPDQRILDAKRGPIKKTAAIKQLPAINDDQKSNSPPDH